MIEDITLTDPLDRAILDLMETVPSSWKNFQANSGSVIWEEAITLLVAACIVEQRRNMKFRIAGYPKVIHLRFRGSGTGAIHEVLRIISQTLTSWLKEAGKTSKDVFPETDAVFQMRLTEGGCKAKEDLTRGQTTNVLDYIHKRGVFQFREAPPSYAFIEFMDIIDNSVRQPGSIAISQAQAKIGDINVTPQIQNNINLDSLASAMENMVEKLLSSKQKPEKQQETLRPVHKRRGPERISLQEAKKRIAILEKWADRQDKNKDPDFMPTSLEQFAKSLFINVEEIKAYQSWYRKYRITRELPDDPRTINLRKLEELFA